MPKSSEAPSITRIATTRSALAVAALAALAISLTGTAGNAENDAVCELMADTASDQSTLDGAATVAQAHAGVDHCNIFAIEGTG
ncbi:hypothetical protein R1X32_31235 [Rhodococcus opacus]|uniref:hypothetical protein n=1 Tax=Rhodococcus opacus TaxID=37919 RepID=UPI00146EFC92|nr:hypothetical protein HJ581_0019775 [Rhodococcus opacus]